MGKRRVRSGRTNTEKYAKDLARHLREAVPGLRVAARPYKDHGAWEVWAHDRQGEVLVACLFAGGRAHGMVRGELVLPAFKEWAAKALPDEVLDIDLGPGRASA